MIRTDRTLKAILAAIFVGLMMVAVATVYTTFLKPNLAEAKRYSVTRIGICNAFLDPDVKPWCAEVRENKKSEHLLAVSP